MSICIPYATKTAEVAEHDTNEIASNKGFIVATTGVQEIRLRHDAATHTVELTQGVYYPWDLKLLHTGSAAASALIVLEVECR
jgi:hypothetical protein